VVCALLRGADYEQAAALAMLLLGLLRTREEFDRRTDFFASRFPLGWSLSVVATVGASVWLGAFAFKHVPAWGGLLWRFDYELEPSRFLRQAVASSASLLLFAVLRVVWPRPSPVKTPGDGDLARAGRAMAAQTSTLPYLAYLRDKTLLFAPGSDSFVMYGVHGRTFVALGDPVGPPADAPYLIRAFLERCSDFSAQPVFHDVSASMLPQYAEYGLTYVRVGDEARLALGGEDGETEAAREARADAAARGLHFRVAPPDDVRELIPMLRAIDEEWRRQAQAPDSAFALGSFLEEYLARFPVALLAREDGAVEAFASLWPGAQGIEVAIDHLRGRGEDPRASERSLVAEVAAWSRVRSYSWLDLGLAPFEDVEGSPVAPLWLRLAARHVAGRGGLGALRAEKAAFQPHWEPRYLAYPGGLSLPLVLADVADLITGAPRRPWRT
jgi:phosphatidylglycerol lysyltransferase